MGIRRKAVNKVSKENIDTSVNMVKMIDFQNDDTSAPATPKSASAIMKNDLKQKDPSAYAQWRNSHICNSNYVGTAGGMETEGARRVFQRSTS